MQFRKILCLLLAIILIMPSNISSTLHATTGDSQEPSSSVTSEVEIDESVDSSQLIIENNNINSEEIPIPEEPPVPEGFQIHIEWADGEFKDGTAYNIVEDSNTNNAVKLRISYSNNQISETGYQPGDLIITVKGIGALNRAGVIEAKVGANKSTDATKDREWTYTWNKTKDTYTFTNNNAIAPNTVLSGYFDMLWTFNSKDSIHGYSQDNITAELLLPDGDFLLSETLSLSNTTTCDIYTIDIDKKPLYSAHGISGNLEYPELYTFIKYTLASNLNNKSRGLNANKETFIFDTDVTDVGFGGTITYSNIPYEKIEDGIYEVNLKNNQTANSQYVIVAYPKEIYVPELTTASITSYGTYYEGNNEGITDEVQLATDSIEFSMPADFNFTDNSGDIHELKESYYEYLMEEDSAFKNKAIKNGGYIRGNKILQGTTEKFLLGMVIETPHKDGASAELVDDFIYIAQNNGDYRQLTSKDYQMLDVTILSTQNILNENDQPIQSGIYPVKVYALQNDETFDVSMQGLYENDEKLVWSGFFQDYNQTITLPQGTTSILIRAEDIVEAIYPTWTLKNNVLTHIEQPYAELNIRFKLDETGLTDEEKANISSGQLVNTMFFMTVGDNFRDYNGGEPKYEDDDINIDLAQKDLDIYGNLLDREKGTITFYEGEKSDYKSYTKLAGITKSGKKYTSTMTIGADFDYAEEENPDKFSLYTVLPDYVSLNGYDIEEDLWDILSFSGMGIDKNILANHCTVEINENYKDSGRTHIALHFDLEGVNIPQDTNVRVSFPVRIDELFYKQGGSTVYVRSAVKIDETLNSYTIGKVNDDGKWDQSELSSDIDNNGETLEFLAYASSYASYTFVDSSELQITKSVRTSSIKEYVQLPEVPVAEFGTIYSYELTVKNGNNTSSDLIITDILENGPNAEWKGTFDSIDLSQADKLGMTYTIYYATSSDVGAFGEDSSWKEYNSETTDKTQIKAIAIDFGESVLGTGLTLNIYINMLAPSDSALKEKITENNFNASFTLISNAGNESVTTFTSLDSNYVQVKLLAPLKNLVITKVDEENNAILNDAKYSLIHKETGKVIGEGVTNSRGQITFKDVPSDEVYILRETEAPYGYELAEDYEFEFTEDKTLRITLTDKRKTGSVIVYKRNALDTLVMVEGAEYTLYSTDGTVIQTAITNINGKVSFENIPWGNYYIKETSSPDGYALDPKQYDVSITRENVHEVQKFNLNDEQDGSTFVVFTKYAMSTTGVQTEEVIQGAVFELIRVTGGQFNSLGLYVTDKDGEIILQDLAYGDYILRETRAPIGYRETENLEFALTPDTKEVTLIAYDQREVGSINIFKKDNLDNIVEGAVFELYDSTKNNVLGTYTTNDTGNISITDLEWGTYYLREKSTLPCYSLNQDWIEIVIEGKTLNVDLTCINETKKGNIILNKTDENGYAITSSPAIFALYNADGTLLQENISTDSEGKLYIENLEWGNYYLKETKAPTGYGLTDETIRFAVNSMNAGITQELFVTNPAKSNTITITKKILADDINYANGDPTFLFKIVGTDVNGKEHTYYRIMRFDKNYVTANVDKDGYTSQSVTVSGLIAGTYEVIEEESSRYTIDKVETTTENTAINEKTATIDLIVAESGDVIFTNSKYEHGDYSHNQSLANVLKTSIKLTGLKATWTGGDAEVYSEIDRNLVEVIALYDDGTFKTLAVDEWSIGESFTGTTFPNINGVYYIPVVYTEDGITKTANFEVNLYGAVKEKIIRLEAAVKDGYQTLPLNYSLNPNMFNVVAVYNDGSKEALNTAQTTTITSPNYPENYPNDMDKTWTVSHPGANSLKIVFDYFKTANKYDYVHVKDSAGTIILKQLYGTKTGTTTTISGDTLQICMYTSASGTAKGFSATIYPLDENGNVITETDIVISPEKTPLEEGMFKVNISLNPNLFDDEVSTSVNMFVRYDDPILVNGTTFKSKTPATATSVVFTDELAPADAIPTDLSAEGNLSVVGWLEGTTWKVSTQRSGVKVIANTDCSNMFSSKTSLTTIDLTYLNTINTINMSNMFSGCTNLKTFDINDLNTTNVADMSYMFSNTTLTSCDLSNLNTSKVANMSHMFESCTKLTSVKFGNTSKVTDMSYMFKGCTVLSSIPLNNVDTSSLQNMSYMFSGTTLHSYDLSAVDTSNVIDMSYIFKDCSKLTSVLFGDTSKVLNMCGILNNCDALESFSSEANNLNTNSATNLSFMFADNAKLKNINLSNINTTNTTTMASMFSSCPLLETLDISSFNTENVTNMSSMFQKCPQITNLNLNHFNTQKVTTMASMFVSVKSSALKFNPIHAKLEKTQKTN